MSELMKKSHSTNYDLEMYTENILWCKWIRI